MKPQDIVKKVAFMKSQGYVSDYIAMHSERWKKLVEENPGTCFQSENSNESLSSLLPSPLGEIRVGDITLDVKTRVQSYVGDAFELEDPSELDSIYIISMGSEILISIPAFDY